MASKIQELCNSHKEEDIFKCMQLKNFKLLKAFKVNGKYIIGIYQGTLSTYDILTKYRQKEDGEWSRIRTPKHTHWAVDILMKMQGEKNKTKEFLDFLLQRWNEIEPIKSEEERQNRLNIEYLIDNYKEEIKNYTPLNNKGEYSIKFLILLAELLMMQEKTNREDAYMFKNLLESLKEGKSIFKIISIATHNGR
ncbi:MAG: hypothetical protein ABGW69_01450 [Nanoarchaeota archaeon]